MSGSRRGEVSRIGEPNEVIESYRSALPVDGDSQPETIALDDLLQALGNFESWAGRDRTDMVEAFNQQWQLMAHPSDVATIAAAVGDGAIGLLSIAVSDAVPPGQILAFRRDPPVATPASRPSASDTLGRIDETLTYYSAGLGEEITVTRDSHPERRSPEPSPGGLAGVFEAFRRLFALQAQLARQLSAALAVQQAHLRVVLPYLHRQLRRARRVDARRLRLRRMRHLYRLRRRCRW